MAAGDRESGNEKRKEKAFERMLADALASDARKDCPDAEILAAFYERSLDAAETGRWRAHFAGCSRCQQALAALAASDPNPLAEEEIARLGELVAAASAPARFVAKQRTSKWAWFFDPRTLAPLAAAAIFGVAIWVAVRSPYVPPAEKQLATAPSASAPTIAENNAAPIAPSIMAQLPPPVSGTGAAQAQEHRAAREMPAAPPPPPAATAGNTGSAPGAAPPSAQAAQAESGAAPQQAPRSTTESVTVTAAAPTVQAPSSDTASRGAAGSAGAAREAEARPAASARQETPRGENENVVVETTEAPVATAAPSEKIVRAQSKMGAVAMYAAAKTNSEIEWRFGSGGRIERSTDGGRTWTQQKSPVQAELLAGSAPSETVCWLVGREGAIVRTTDGVKWEVVASPEEAEENGQPLDWTLVEARDALYAVIRTENGRRFYTSDGGKTWQPQ
jgi:hypothetical protein